ncbi:MAG: BrnA antitoxin family protein [Candidatus Korobacteraceae bacterium]
MPKLSAEKRRELQQLAKRPEEEIDLSDIPKIREIPSDAVIGRFYRPKKKSVTIRLDADVIAWLKASGKGYQTRINDYLRQLMRRRHRRRS